MGVYYIQKPDELYHYGVKGMKWGVRKQSPMIGMPRRRRVIGVSPNRQQKISRRRKVARGAAIVAGTALVAYGGYHLSKILRSPNGQKMLASGKQKLIDRGLTISNRAHNVSRLTRTVVHTPARIIGRSPIGRTALKAYGVASTVSDINTAQQWARKMKKQGKVTKNDVADLAKDLVIPIPDNLPKLRKKKT